MFVCTLLITTILPITGTVLAGDEENPGVVDGFDNITSDGPSNSIWFVKGIFRYLDEDEEYIYLKAISTKLRGFGNGASVYRLFDCSVKFAKPFYGFLSKGSLPIPGIGVCREWDYVDGEGVEQSAIEQFDNYKIGFNCHVEYEGPGICFFNIFVKTGKDTYFATMTHMWSVYSDTEITVDDWHHTGKGVVHMIGYTGKYEYNDTTQIFAFDGDALFCFARGK